MTAAFIIALLIACGLGWVARLQWDALGRILDREAAAKGALTAIADATRNGKSGTAKRIYRMAMEGMNNEQA